MRFQSYFSSWRRIPVNIGRFGVHWHLLTLDLVIRVVDGLLVSLSVLCVQTFVDAHVNGLVETFAACLADHFASRLALHLVVDVLR